MQERDEIYQGEYRVLRSPINRGGAAILYFGFLMLLPGGIWEMSSRSVRMTLAVLMALVLAGLIFALRALGRDRTKLPAKIAVLLHIGGVLWIVVPVAGVLWVMNR